MDANKLSDKVKKHTAKQILENLLTCHFVCGATSP